MPRLKRTLFHWALGVGYRTRELERAGRTPDRVSPCNIGLQTGSCSRRCATCSAGAWSLR